MPLSTCYFSSCAFVGTPGSQSVQGSISTMVTASVSGSGSTALISFVSNTSTIQSQALYLSCFVPSQFGYS